MAKRHYIPVTADVPGADSKNTCALIRRVIRTALTAEVLRQMEEQMARSEEVVYFPEELTAISPDQNFYLDENGNIVLVFDEYTVAPGSMGMPEFTIPASVVQDLLR